MHGPEQYSYYGPRTDFYVDNMISRQLLQKAVYGHVWVSCLCLTILWKIFLLLPIYQAQR